VESTTVIYTRGGVAEAFSLLNQACRRFGYSAWAIDGKDAYRLKVKPSITCRIAILALETKSWAQAQVQDQVGTVHIMRIAGQKTRITIRHETLAGETLPRSSRPRLEDFCLWFIHFLESKGQRIPGNPPQASPSTDSPSDEHPVSPSPR
jgi:hypothetical protein